MELKPTGLSMELYETWRDNIGRRSAIERSIATLNRDFDLSLLQDDTCFECSLNDYSDGSGIVIDEDSTIVLDLPANARHSN